MDRADAVLVSREYSFAPAAALRDRLLRQSQREPVVPLNQRPQLDAGELTLRHHYQPVHEHVPRLRTRAEQVT